MTIYWAGGEDCDLYQVGGGSVGTTAGRYRSAYSRCYLETGSSSQVYWQNWLPFSLSTFWHGARWFQLIHGQNSAGFRLMVWLDTTQVERLRILSTGTNDTFKVEKVSGGGTATQLGSNFTMVCSTTVPDKLDVFINYAVSGTFTIYLNGVQQFSYSGDVTTDSVTTLTNFRVGNVNNQSTGWSEMIITDTDSRSMSLQTLAPVANGNTHNFDFGSPAAANVNEITLSDATLDGATSAGLIDQYTIPAIASGTYVIVAVGVSARMEKGGSGPSKMDLGVRSGGTDYWSADQALTVNWTDYQNWWPTDPNTSATWSGLPSNIGLKSVT